MLLDTFLSLFFLSSLDLVLLSEVSVLFPPRGEEFNPSCSSRVGVSRGSGVSFFVILFFLTVIQLSRLCGSN